MKPLPTLPGLCLLCSTPLLTSISSWGLAQVLGWLLGPGPAVLGLSLTISNLFPQDSNPLYKSAITTTVNPRFQETESPLL